MRVALLTREYPPDVYGGAGVHVEHLAKELTGLPGLEVEVRRFASGSERRRHKGRPTVREFGPSADLGGDDGSSTAAVLGVMSVDLAMASSLEAIDVVHSHTWYTNLAGHLTKLLYGVPHVLTAHSLEPMRPWKAEQLGPGGYDVSRFLEQTAMEGADAVIAVSEAMRADIEQTYPQVQASRIEVIHNGLDPAAFEPDGRTDALDRYGIAAGRPIVLFVGRITRQKGITHLLDAVPDIDARAQIVLAASAPDTPDLAREVEQRVTQIKGDRGDVVWIDRALAHDELIQLMTHATVLVCPSTYEPLGIVNLEAMACEAAVVATDTGGIPEVVEDGRTGFLVPFEVLHRTGTPRDPVQFARDIAERVNALISDPDLAQRFGEAGRQRVIERFTWRAVAERTAELYRSLVS